MVIFLIALAIIVICGLKKRSDDEYMSLKQTENIKGVFIAVIFLSHLKQYLTLYNSLDLLYVQILEYIGQLMVVIFFFYSGYGIFVSYHKNTNYEKDFFIKRIFKTWFHFVVAVVIFFIVNIVLGIRYPIKTVLLSFIGWESIGNSNWFIFDILILYLCVLICFKIAKKFGFINKDSCVVASVFVFTCIIIVLLRLIKQSWWYDTLLGFPCGMAFYLCKDKINSLFIKMDSYLITGFCLIVVFIVSYLIHNILFYNICACTLCLIICWITNKIRIDNFILSWLGIYSFYMYIYMRVPMIIFEHFNIVDNVYLYSCLSLLFTLVIAFIMKIAQEKIDHFIIKGSYIQ